MSLSFSCHCIRCTNHRREHSQENESHTLIGLFPRKECMSVWSSPVGTGSVTWLRPERLRRRLAWPRKNTEWHLISRYDANQRNIVRLNRKDAIRQLLSSNALSYICSVKIYLPIIDGTLVKTKNIKMVREATQVILVLGFCPFVTRTSGGFRLNHFTLRDMCVTTSVKGNK